MRARCPRRKRSGVVPASRAKARLQRPGSSPEDSSASRVSATCGLDTARLCPMNARVDHLIDEALALAPDERSAVVLALLDSLDGEDGGSVTKGWADGVSLRKSGWRSG